MDVTKEAGHGKIFVCPACGDTAQKRENFGDTSCVINSRLCWDKTEDGEKKSGEFWKPVRQSDA